MRGTLTKMAKSVSDKAIKNISGNVDARAASDIVAIGGGVSAICFLNEFTKQDGIENSKVKVIDKNNFKTVPWHHEASPVPLLQHQSFGDYGDDFLNWADDNRAKIVDFVDEKGGELSKDWVKENKDFVLNSSRDELVSDWARRFPRAVVGLYLDERREESTQRAEQKGVDLEFVNGEVKDVKKIEDGYKILLASGNNPISGGLANSLLAKELLIGIGIPGNPEKESLKGAEGYFGDMYKDNNFKCLTEQINKKYEEKGGEKVNVNITGFGPSGLDVAYWLHQHGVANPEFEDKYNLTVIGNINKLRPGAYKSDKEQAFNPAFKGDYKDAEELKSDIKSNINNATEQGYTEGETRNVLRNTLKSAIKDMPQNVQDSFSGPAYMPIYLNMLSSEAYESRSSVDKLIDKGILKTIEAKVDIDSLNKKDGGGFEFKYFDKQNNIFNGKSDIYVNCAHNLTKEQEELSKGSWLEGITSDKTTYITGFNSYLSGNDNYKFNPLEVDPQAPAIAKYVKQTARDLASRIKEQNLQNDNIQR
jgi:uncharacterized NAD(P)/FAD-binding protein YdhS